MTEKVKSLCIPKDYDFEDELVNCSKIFMGMQSLQVLIIGLGTFSSACAITYLPSSLQFIEWGGYPSISLPESFEPSQLVVLRFYRSCLVELWPISKVIAVLSFSLSFQYNKVSVFFWFDRFNAHELDEAWTLKYYALF